jgi:hypothetical protein
MGQSLLLPAGILVIGWVAALFFATPRHLVRGQAGEQAGQETDLPVQLRFSHASTTREAIPASPALPHVRGS